MKNRMILFVALLVSAGGEVYGSTCQGSSESLRLDCGSMTHGIPSVVMNAGTCSVGDEYSIVRTKGELAEAKAAFLKCVRREARRLGATCREQARTNSTKCQQENQQLAQRRAEIENNLASQDQVENREHLEEEKEEISRRISENQKNEEQVFETAENLNLHIADYNFDYDKVMKAYETAKQLNAFSLPQRSGSSSVEPASVVARKQDLEAVSQVNPLNSAAVSEGGTLAAEEYKKSEIDQLQLSNQSRAGFSSSVGSGALPARGSPESLKGKKFESGHRPAKFYSGASNSKKFSPHSEEGGSQLSVGQLKRKIAAAQNSNWKNWDLKGRLLGPHSNIFSVVRIKYSRMNGQNQFLP